MKYKSKSQGADNRQLLYGVNPVLEAMRAGRMPREIVVAEGARDERLRQIIELAHMNRIPIKRAPRVTLDRATGTTRHQGIAARIAPAAYRDPEEFLDTIAARVGSDREPLVVVLDGIEDPRNLGAILRTAECAGADGVFIPERRAVGLNETVAKASAGAVEHLPIARIANLSRLLDQLKERNLWVVGATSDAANDYSDWDWTRPSAIVLGAEGAGLHRLVRERCDALVRIPVHGKIESLNVSVATGIILYEALRQRSRIQSEQAPGVRR